MIENEIHLYCGNDWLADGSPFVNDTDEGKGVVESYRPGSRKELEVVGLIDALSPSIFDRFTLEKEITFRVGREHESQAAAVDFALAHDEDIEARADLIVELIEEGTTFTWRATNCGWRSVTQDPTGIFTVTEYRVVLGSRLVRTNDGGVDVGSVVDGGAYSDGYASQGVADGGHYTDLPEPATAGYIEGGTYS